GDRLELAALARRHAAVRTPGPAAPLHRRRVAEAREPVRPSRRLLERLGEARHPDAGRARALRIRARLRGALRAGPELTLARALDRRRQTGDVVEQLLAPVARTQGHGGMEER